MKKPWRLIETIRVSLTHYMYHQVRQTFEMHASRQILEITICITKQYFRHVVFSKSTPLIVHLLIVRGHVRLKTVQRYLINNILLWWSDDSSNPASGEEQPRLQWSKTNRTAQRWSRFHTRGLFFSVLVVKIKLLKSTEPLFDCRNDHGSFIPHKTRIRRGHHVTTAVLWAAIQETHGTELSFLLLYERP
jgi:hypothetical protein